MPTSVPVSVAATPFVAPAQPVIEVVVPKKTEAEIKIE